MLRNLSLFALLLCADLSAQVTQEIFESFKLQERRDVRYYIPEDYDAAQKYPVIVVLDGDYLFDQTVANAKFYHKFHGMPASIVVGVDQSKNGLRYDDCAFEADTGLPTEKGKQFFEFVGTELLPYLDTKYNTAAFKTIVGYDITANFQNYWLFKEKSLFNAYINISPSLAPQMEARVPARLMSFDQPLFYQLIIEGLKDDDTARIMQMNNAIKAMQKENLHYGFTQYEGADDISIATYGIGKAFDNIVELNDIMAIYAASRKKEDVESLKPLSDMCKKQFPDTMLGFYFEGEYYEQIGEPKKAFKTFEKAFNMEEIDFLTKEIALEKIDALKADFGF